MDDLNRLIDANMTNALKQPRGPVLSQAATRNNQLRERSSMPGGQEISQDQFHEALNRVKELAPNSAVHGHPKQHALARMIEEAYENAGGDADHAAIYTAARFAGLGHVISRPTADETEVLPNGRLRPFKRNSDDDYTTGGQMAGQSGPRDDIERALMARQLRGY